MCRKIEQRKIRSLKQYVIISSCQGKNILKHYLHARVKKTMNSFEN